MKTKLLLVLMAVLLGVAAASDVVELQPGQSVTIKGSGTPMYNSTVELQPGQSLTVRGSAGVGAETTAQVSPRATTTCGYFIDNSSKGCGGSGCVNSNSGTSLTNAWRDPTQIANVKLDPGTKICIVGQATPNATNGGVYRFDGVPIGNYQSTGNAFSATGQIQISSYDSSRQAILTNSKCYGAATRLCAGTTATVWHRCGLSDPLCHNLTAAGITSVYEFTRPSKVTGEIYLDDPDPLTTTDMWTNRNKMLVGASCLPGESCSRTPNMYQAAMTAGTWFDDNTRLYIWMANGDDPGSHTVEAPTGNSGALFKYSMSATQRQYVYFSYFKMMYYSTAGIAAWQADQAGPNLVVDHVTGGAFGMGPVANEGGYYGGLAILSTQAAIPGGSMPTAGYVRFSYNKVRWCGSHNCYQIHGTKGRAIYSYNEGADGQHGIFDIKCPYNVLVDHNYAHDAWTGPIIGNDTGTQGMIGSIYMETDFDTCSGGTALITNNTVDTAGKGIDCQPGSVTTPGIKQTCRVYNNTVIEHIGAASGYPSCYMMDGKPKMPMVGDFKNNICEVLAGVPSRGFNWAFGGGTAADNTVTEDHNLYFRRDKPNANAWNNIVSQTLASWQANCGGGGKCGTADLFQVDPLFADETPVSDPASPFYGTMRLLSTSPAVGVGSSASGTTSTTLGAQATTVVPVPEATPTPPAVIQ